MEPEHQPDLASATEGGARELTLHRKSAAAALQVGGNTAGF